MGHGASVPDRFDAETAMLMFDKFKDSEGFVSRAQFCAVLNEPPIENVLPSHAAPEYAPAIMKPLKHAEQHATPTNTAPPIHQVSCLRGGLLLLYELARAVGKKSDSATSGAHHGP